MTLVNIFLKSMCVTGENPSIINIDYIGDSLKDEPDLLYGSTVHFNEKFTKKLSKKYKELQTINVRIK